MGFLTEIPSLVYGALGLLGGLGLLVTIINMLKKAYDETIEAVTKIRWFFMKYNSLFTVGEGKRDFYIVLREVDQALESYAIVLEKLKLNKQAKFIKDLIK